jgi:DNA-binding MarR family transcriptional regulator
MLAVEELTPQSVAGPTGHPVTGPLAATFLLSRLGASVGHELAAALEPLGIEPRHFGLLRTLIVLEGESQRAVGEALGLHPNRIVALVDDLESRDLVRRQPHPSDRRAHTVVVTESGRDLLKKAFTRAVAIETRLCSELQAEERELLLNLLNKLQPLEPSPSARLQPLTGIGPNAPL